MLFKIKSAMHNNENVASNQSGFTLVELVVVIVILGILGVAALGKFRDLSSEANIAVLKSMGGTILSTGRLVYAKAIINGVQGQLKTNIVYGGETVEIRYGFPSSSRSEGVPKIIGGSFASEWTWSSNYRETVFWLTTASQAGRSGQYINQTAVLASGCYLRYFEASSSGSSPTITYDTDDC